MSVIAQDHDIAIDGLRLHYRQWGDAGRRPLLFLHASGCHAHWWHEVDPLLAADYDVFAPDLRGHGDSGRPEPPDYHFDAYVADLAGLIQHLGLHDFDLIGHSMGGYIALRYASMQPEGLHRLIVADMLCDVSGDILEQMHRASERPEPTFATREEAIGRFRLQPPETTASPELLDMLAEAAVCQTASGEWTFKFDRRARKHPAVHVWELLPQITCPVLVVRGELSPLMPEANAERIARELAHGEWTNLPGAYHNLMLDNLSGFVEIVRTFLIE